MTTDPTPLDLLKRAEGYLSALHGSVARHDNLAANLGCAGCELAGQIRSTLAAAVVSPPATNQAEVRDRIADVLAAADGWRWAPGFKAESPTWQSYQDRADAVLAVLPGDNRATVLREAAETLGRMDYDTDSNDYGYDTYRDAWNGGVMDAAEELRRVAAEPSGDLVEDYLRFLRGQGPEPDLSSLPAEQRAAITGQFEIVRALADRDPELPPLDRDPVAVRLGLHADVSAVEAQQQECSASISGRCLREAESETACATDDGECVRGGRPANEAQQPDTEAPRPADPIGCGHETAVAELAQALRLTREYVGEELLPAVEGWSWYDALRRHAPHELGSPAAPTDGPGGVADEEQPTAEVVHGCPPDGSGLTPCCGRTPFELPLADRISSEAPVTCPGVDRG